MCGYATRARASMIVATSGDVVSALFLSSCTQISPRVEISHVSLTVCLCLEISRLAVDLEIRLSLFPDTFLRLRSPPIC